MKRRDIYDWTRQLFSTRTSGIKVVVPTVRGSSFFLRYSWCRYVPLCPTLLQFSFWSTPSLNIVNAVTIGSDDIIDIYVQSIVLSFRLLFILILKSLTRVIINLFSQKDIAQSSLIVVPSFYFWKIFNPQTDAILHKKYININKLIMIREAFKTKQKF